MGKSDGKKDLKFFSAQLLLFLLSNFSLLASFMGWISLYSSLYCLYSLVSALFFVFSCLSLRLFPVFCVLSYFSFSPILFSSPSLIQSSSPNFLCSSYPPLLSSYSPFFSVSFQILSTSFLLTPLLLLFLYSPLLRFPDIFPTLLSLSLLLSLFPSFPLTLIV